MTEAQGTCREMAGDDRQKGRRKAHKDKQPKTKCGRNSVDRLED